MSARLPSGIMVSALLRRANDSGGMGMVRARGDEQAGAVLVIATGHDATPRLMERGIGPDGRVAMIESTPRDGESVDEYWRRRRSRDPDLWVVELDSPSAERFVAETMLDG